VNAVMNLRVLAPWSLALTNNALYNAKYKTFNDEKRSMTYHF
jgi:hypothetical protein